MTKCTFHKFGTSGEVEKHDALCLLPLNIVNEKVYIFLWFWFIMLSVLSILVVLYRIIIVISPKMRAYLLYIRFRLIRREVINTIVKKSYVGDWFLFYMLGISLSPFSFFVLCSHIFTTGFPPSSFLFSCMHAWCESYTISIRLLSFKVMFLRMLFCHFPGQNVDSMIFKEVMHELARKLGHLGKDFSTVDT